MIDVSSALSLLGSAVNGLQAVYVFGSAARGDEVTDSDVDLVEQHLDDLKEFARIR